MKQFILSREPENNTVRLKGGDYRYLVRVRRLAAGERFPAVLPGGTETLVQILSISRGVLTGKCLPPDEAASDEAASLEATSSEAAAQKTKLPPIILLQALPKGEKMDLIVRQAAEGGITEIVPFLSEFSIAKVKEGRQKFSRWERIIKEARQQSGSKIATAIRPPLAKEELFDYWKKQQENGALGLLFHHEGLENKSLHSYLDSIPPAVVMAVGPEGGFSDGEVAFFLENGFKPLTIGDTVLRTETAALYCAAAIRILLLERNSWELKQAKPGSV